MRLLKQLATTAAMATVVLSGCSTPADDVVIRSAVVGHPGDIVNSAPLSDVDPAVSRLARTADRVVFRSTNGVTNESTEVVGSVFIPLGKAPHNGWPTIALVQGNADLDLTCGQPVHTALLGMSNVIAGLLEMGHAVTVVDYPGGPDGQPPVDAETAGLNVIDAVRAVRKASADVSNRWAAYGTSQGGAAVWAANEQTESYAPELQLVGSVSIVPTADTSGFATLAAERALSPSQTAAYVHLLTELERGMPNFDIDDYRRAISPETWGALVDCDPALSGQRQEALADLTPEQLVPATPQATVELTNLLSKLALPQRRAGAPMLVFYGGRDPFINPEWTRAAIGRACALDSRIAAVFQPDKGHENIDSGIMSKWVASRFDGAPAPSTC